MRTCIAAAVVLGFVALSSDGGSSVPKKEDMPKYIKMLQSAQKASDRATAADMIGRRGAVQINDVKEAVPLLQKATTKDIDATVRKAAATALGNLATDAAGSIPPLREAIKDKSQPVALAAIGSLGQFGMEAREAVPDIREFAKNAKDKQTKKFINEAIGKILGKKKKA